jgi:Secretion system C-terminal sorting domain
MKKFRPNNSLSLWSDSMKFLPVMVFMGIWSFLPLNVRAQTKFQTSFSNGIYMCGNDIRLKDGYYYIGGTAKDAVSSGFFLMKTDNYGDSIWTKEFKASSPIEGKKIILQDDFIYMIGNSDPNTGSSKGFLAKSTAGGEVLWSKSFGTAGSCEFNDAILQDDSTLVLTGSITGTGSGGKDIFVTVFDTSGTFRWSKAYGKPGNESGNAIIGTPDSSFYLTGNIDYNDPDGDIFILKLSMDGSPQWCRTYNILRDTYDGQKVYDLIKNSNNQLVISGETKVYEFSPSDQVWNPLIIKTDIAGNVIYAKDYALNSGGGAGYQVMVTEDGYFAFSGYMRSCVGLLVKTNQLGATEWSKVYGWDQSGDSYQNQINAFIQQGGSYVMTGFVETQYDTSLYLIKANHLGETGCKETETPAQAEPHTNTPVINDLSLNVTPFVPDISVLPITSFSPGPSVYIYCETPTYYDQQVQMHGVYPNPVKDYLQLTGFSDSPGYRLSDALGKQVGSGNNKVIDFRSYQSGVYFLTIYDNEACSTFKVLKID